MSLYMHRRIARLERWNFLLVIVCILLGLVLAIVLVNPAKAQEPNGVNCDAYDSIVKHLSKNYQESRAATAVTANGVVMEVLSSPEGTWTLIMVWPNGRACFYASGDGWRLVKQEPGTDG